MRTFLPVMLCAGILLGGCRTDHLESKKHPGGRGEGDAVPDVASTIFMSAYAFDEGYDWRNDPDWGGSGERLMLLGGDRILYETEAGTEELGLHHIVKGALFQCRRSAGRTFLTRNGKAYMDWEGEESVWDMAMDGQDMLCLCSSEEAGTCLRRNGKEVRRYEGCWPTGGLYVDGEELLFGLAGESLGYAGEKTEWLRTGIDKALYERVECLRANGGAWLCWAADGLSYAGNGDDFILDQGKNEVLGLLHDDGAVYVEESRSGFYCIRKDFSILYSSQLRFTRKAAVIDGDDICALGTLTDGSWAVCHEGVLQTLPAGCTPLPGCGLAYSYGRLMFPVVLEDGTAGVWDNGKILSLGFNGYVDHISIGRGSSNRFWMSR